jgi:signal transduction histidine kinase
VRLAEPSVPDSLRSVPLFAYLEPDTVGIIAAHGQLRVFEAGQMLFRQGDTGDSLYVILRGALRVYQSDEHGVELDLGRLQAGASLGELALLDGGPRSASVAALEPTTCFVLGREAFLAQLHQLPGLLAAVLANLTQTVRKTSERLFEDELQRRRIQAQMEIARYRGLAQMVAGVAHEINTPLGIVNTAASFVRQRLTEDVLNGLPHEPAAQGVVADIHEALRLMEANINRAHRLVQEFKKLSASQIHDEREMLDLLGVIEETVDLFRISARQAGLIISVHDRVATPATRNWLGYRGYLSQVLLNLLTNVERYAYPNGAGGRVDIDVERDDAGGEPSFVVSVRDFGRGIAAPDLPRVFDPFFTTGRDRGGTGLGLAIVHNLVTSGLGGSVDILSSLDSGTTVVIRVPCTAPAQPPQPN